MKNIFHRITDQVRVDILQMLIVNKGWCMPVFLKIFEYKARFEPLTIARHTLSREITIKMGLLRYFRCCHPRCNREIHAFKKKACGEDKTGCISYYHHACT